MTYEQIIKDLGNRIYHPVYFLAGEEPYYIDKITDHIARNVLDESEKEFNQTILYGRDTDVLTVISEARRFPMMANHQVVIVKEAQHLRNIEELGAYLDNPLQSTILVICHKYKKVDKRKQFGKELAKKAVLFESERLREYKIPDWITQYVAGMKLSITPQAVALLTEYLGTDLSRIDNALQKLIMNKPGDNRITTELIQQYIGINKDFNNFELQKAIGTGDVVKANRIITYFTNNSKEHPLVLTFGSLYSLFSKVLVYHQVKGKPKNEAASILRVNPYFMKDYDTYARKYSPQKVRKVLHYLREYDLKSKGVGNASATDGELLKELVWKIMH